MADGVTCLLWLRQREGWHEASEPAVPVPGCHTRFPPGTDTILAEGNIGYCDWALTCLITPNPKGGSSKRIAFAIWGWLTSRHGSDCNASGESLSDPQPHIEGSCHRSPTPRTRGQRPRSSQRSVAVVRPRSVRLSCRLAPSVMPLARSDPSRNPDATRQAGEWRRVRATDNGAQPFDDLTGSTTGPAGRNEQAKGAPIA